MQPDGNNLVAELFDRASASGSSDNSALRQGQLELSYSELETRVRRGASLLRSRGVGPGDRVAVFSPDSIDSAVVLLATIYSGAIALPISELSAANDLRDRLNDAAVKLVAVGATLHESMEQIRGELSEEPEIVRLEAGEAGFAAQSALVAPGDAHPLGEQSACLLIYSASASQGKQGFRGVVHCASTIKAAYESFGKAYLGLGPSDRVLSTVRFSTAYGLGMGLLFPLMAGALSCLLPEQTRSDAVVGAVVRAKPTVFAATPSLYGQLARDSAGSKAQGVLAQTRFCVAGAEDMPPKVIAMTRAFLGTDVTVGFGLTEAFQFVIAGAAKGARPGNCGTPMQNVEARIIGDEGKIVGADEIGTLELKSPSLSFRSFSQGGMVESKSQWLRTRDRFMADEEGNYYHCGRVDSLFKVGGKWVSPAEVEAALLDNESVWECAVIGADDEDGLIKPLAFIVPNIGHEPGAELEAALRSYVKEQLAPYKYPRWIEFVDELPKGPAGVILRYRLRTLSRRSRARRRAETAAGDKK